MMGFRPVRAARCARRAPTLVKRGNVGVAARLAVLQLTARKCSARAVLRLSMPPGPTLELGARALHAPSRRRAGGPMEKFTAITPQLYEYVLAHRSDHGDPVLRALAEETAKLGPISMMQASPEQASFMTLLARAIGARSAVEIGTFTGYSALCIARGLADDGRLLCCDLNEEWTAIGRDYWKRAGVDQKIELRIGPALETLRALPRTVQFDFAFIDA